MNPEIRFGIIGPGSIARTHARAIASVPGAVLTAVCGRREESTLPLARELGIEAFTDLGSFLSRAPVDAVTLATPSGLHGSIGAEAARAGKHILCEKPLEINPRRVDELIESCRKAGVILAPIFQQRFGEGVALLREAMSQGRLGRLLFAGARIKWMREQSYYDSGAWRGTWDLDGGGCLMNQGIHTVDLLLHLAGPATEVTGAIATRTHDRIEVEDNAAGLIRFANGAFGTLEASTSCAPGLPATVELSGENGTVRLEGDRIAIWEFRDSAPIDARIHAHMEKDRGEGLGSGASDPKGISDEGHRRQVADLVAAITEGRNPAVSAEEARRPVALIHTLYESARTGRTLPVT